MKSRKSHRAVSRQALTVQSITSSCSPPSRKSRRTLQVSWQALPMHIISSYSQVQRPRQNRTPPLRPRGCRVAVPTCMPSQRAPGSHRIAAPRSGRSSGCLTKRGRTFSKTLLQKCRPCALLRRTGRTRKRRSTRQPGRGINYVSSSPSIFLAPLAPYQPQTSDVRCKVNSMRCKHAPFEVGHRCAAWVATRHRDAERRMSAMARICLGANYRYNLREYREDIYKVCPATPAGR
jgi:hypothetical protein